MKKQFNIDDYQRFLTEHKGLAPTTIIRYRRRVSRFLDRFGLPENLSPQELFDAIQKLTCSPSDHNQWVAVIRRYKEYSEFISGESYSFDELLRIKSARKRLPKPLSLKEINAICDEIPHTLEGIKHRTIIELLYCGLRNSECCKIRLQDLQDRAVNIIGKGSKERIVPINDVAWDFIIDLAFLIFMDEDSTKVLAELGREAAFTVIRNKFSIDFLFRTESGYPMYPRQVRRIVTRYAKLADVHNAHPHRFRHSFATHSLDAGLGNIIALKDVLGHANLNMVNLYVLTSTAGRDLVRGFHPRQRRG